VSDADKAPEVDANEVATNKTRSKAAAVEKSAKTKDPNRKGLFARFALFMRQVIAELKKVIWPTRSELINYTWVVVVFVVMMAAVIGVMDFVFAKGVLAVFG